MTEQDALAAWREAVAATDCRAKWPACVLWEKETT